MSNELLDCERLDVCFKREGSQYQIIVGDSLLLDDELRSEVQKHGNVVVIVTDDNVKALYGENLSKHFQKCGMKTFIFSFPAGEENKTRATKEWLEDQLLGHQCNRDICVVALGGGVVTDVAGYLASTYCRGVPLILCPTTLLGMVDACIGGKTGVNTAHGKNLIGTVYQPKSIFISIDTLKTLPQNEFLNGVVEMIKHGLIRSKEYVDFLVSNANEILKRDSEILQQVILESCRIKKEIVEADEFETGKRRLLNFGHTVGHALELVTYYKMSHGQAVAIGIVLESKIAVEMGYMQKDALRYIVKAFKAFNISTNLPSQISMKSIYDAMALDKKNKNHKARIVMLSDIGEPHEFDGEYCNAFLECVDLTRIT